MCECFCKLYSRVGVLVNYIWQSSDVHVKWFFFHCCRPVNDIPTFLKQVAQRSTIAHSRANKYSVIKTFDYSLNKRAFIYYHYSGSINSTVSRLTVPIIKLITVIVTSTFDDELINHFPIINLWDILDAQRQLTP